MKIFVMSTLVLAFASVGMSGDLVLPLGMMGSAGGEYLQYDMQLSGGSVSGLSCSPSYSFEPASGILEFGNEEYTIKGFCRRGTSTDHEILSVNDNQDTMLLRNAKLTLHPDGAEFTGTLTKGHLGGGQEHFISSFTLTK